MPNVSPLENSLIALVVSCTYDMHNKISGDLISHLLTTVACNGTRSALTQFGTANEDLGVLNRNAGRGWPAP